ncbi:MAG: transposase [Pseudonocardiales bacterium]|nr:transposase [Pseudonocardia sp.]MDT7618910.1 transposase [Pseudonocardiales bacterium]
MRLGFAAVDDVRRRIQQEQLGHHGRTGDPLFGIRRLLRRRYDHHSQRSWTRLPAGLDAGDTADEQLARTWVAAQDLHLIFTCSDRARAEHTLYGGWSTAPTQASPNLPAWPAPSTPGTRSCWPTSTPTARPTGPQRRSTC